MIVDDHPAMRAGLLTVLETEPDVVPVGAAAGVFEARPLFAEARPDLVMLDFHLPGQSSLRLVRELKGKALAPKVLLYSAHAGPSLALAGALAGADGVLSKGAEARELSEAIRRIGAGEAIPSPPAEDLVRAAGEQIPEEDLPLVAMLVHGASTEDVANARRMDPKAVERRIDALLERLEPEPLAAGQD